MAGVGARGPGGEGCYPRQTTGCVNEPFRAWGLIQYGGYLLLDVYRELGDFQIKF